MLATGLPNLQNRYLGEALFMYVELQPKFTFIDRFLQIPSERYVSLC